jgi:hypothetical protein
VAEFGTAQLLRDAFPGLKDLCPLISDLVWRERVIAAIDTYCANSLESNSPIVGRNSILESGPMTIKEVADRIGRRFETVAAAIDGNEATIRGKRVTAKGRFRRVLAEGDIVRLEHLLDDPTTVKGASRLLALPPARVRALTRSGTLSFSGGRLKKSEFSKLAKAIRQSAKASSTDQLLHPLRLVLRDSVDVADTGPLLLAIQTGAVSIIANEENDFIGEWLVSKAEVEAWATAHRAEKSSYLTLGQVAKMLSLKHDVVLELVRKGLIVGAVKFPGIRGIWKITTAQVEAFRRKYGPLSEWTSLAGIRARDGFLWAQSQGLNVVSGPQIDGARQYIVERNSNSNPSPSPR